MKYTHEKKVYVPDSVLTEDKIEDLHDYTYNRWFELNLNLFKRGIIIRTSLRPFSYGSKRGWQLVVEAPVDVDREIKQWEDSVNKKIKEIGK